MGLSPAQWLAVPVRTCVFPALGTQGPCKAAGPASDRATTKSPETSPSSVPFVAVKAQLTSAPINRTPAKQTCRLWHRSAIKQETSYTGPRHVHSGKKPHTRGAGRRPQTRACRCGFFSCTADQTPPSSVWRCRVGTEGRKSQGPSAPLCGHQKGEPRRETVVQMHVF